MKDRIKKVRKHFKLSQQAFGAKVGKLSRDVINNIENGRAEASELVIRAISTTFGVNYKWLETGDGDMFISSEEADVAALTNIMIGDDTFAKNLFRSFARLGPEDWEHLRQFMEEVIRSTQADEQKK